MKKIKYQNRKIYGTRYSFYSAIANPDNYSYLHCKGWGLYKQGKYQEALDILQRSWDLRREKARYNHEAFLHLEAAKKAVAGQKNN
jgi:hypothetical protein